LIRASALIAALALAAPAAAAPAIEVSPVTITLAPRQEIAALRLRNVSDQPMAFNAALKAWTQRNGEDAFAPAPEMIVAPPAFVIAPGREQIVRIGAPGAARERGAVERAYRLFFVQQPLAGIAPGQGLQVRLELALPVFVAPDAPEQPGAPLVTRAGPGRIRIANPSNQHIVLALGAAGDDMRLPRYLLAGAAVERPTPRANALSIVFAAPDARALKHQDYDLAPPRMPLAPDR
jgi:P pilus assembly chaperone PapD